MITLDKGKFSIDLNAQGMRSMADLVLQTVYLWGGCDAEIERQLRYMATAIRERHDSVSMTIEPYAKAGNDECKTVCA